MSLKHSLIGLNVIECLLTPKCLNNRQRAGHHGHPALPAAADHHQPLHCLVGHCRPHCGPSSGALWFQLHPTGKMAVWKLHVRILDSDRRAVCDGKHRDAVRDRSGPLPGHHLATSLSDSAYQVPTVWFHSSVETDML